MKDYNDYMDNISVDEQLHDKIVQRATGKLVQSNPNRPMFRRAALAACAVILLLGIWLIPGLWTQNAIGPEYLTHQDDLSGTASPAMPLELFPLTFNAAGEELSPGQIPGRILAPSFFHELTDEQFGAVLPTLDPHFTAVASYWIEPTSQIWWTEQIDRAIDLMPDEVIISHIEVSAYDCEERTHIRLARGQVFDGYIWMDMEPQVSYVHGAAVTAAISDGYFVIDGQLARLYRVQADFMLGDIAYRVSYLSAGRETGKLRLTELVNQLILGGPADFAILADPAIPELRDEVLPLEQARDDPDFGAYLPVNVPLDWEFNHARRSLNQHDNSLAAHWDKEFGTIRWVARTPTEDDLRRIVCVDEREKYDMSLYSIPLADSVPSELWDFVFDPVFPVEEMNIDMVRARAFSAGRRGGDAPEWSINFSVLYDDVLVSIWTSGISPEQVWDMLAGLD